MSSAKENGNRPLILSIDNDFAILELVDRILKVNGYDVVCAHSGAEAFRILPQNKPDLIMLDVMMPNMDGYEVCSRLRQDKSLAGVPVIFLTAMGEEKDKAKAFAAGASDYLVKPCRKNSLLDKIKFHLALREQWQMLIAESATPSALSAAENKLLRFEEYLSQQVKVGSPLSPENLYTRCDELQITSQDMAQHIAEFFKVPYLPQVNPQNILIAELPSSFCKDHFIVPANDISVDIALVLSNPFDPLVQGTLQWFEQKNRTCRMVITEPENIIALYDSRDRQVTQSDAEKGTVIVPPSDNARITRFHRKKFDLPKAVEAEKTPALPQDDPAVVKAANDLMTAALRAGASGLHVEPRENALGVRYRVDGALYDVEPLAKRMQSSIITRFKTLASLDIAETLAPQQGIIRVAYKSRFINLHISTLPSRHGERLMIHVLDKSNLSLDFDSLGFDEHNLTLLRAAIRKKHGLIVVAGPKDSGKSTTLYTAAQAISGDPANIITIEESIEHELHRVTQVHAGPGTALSTKDAFFAVMQQDPDVVMLGEMRDQDVIQLAVNAALCETLVLAGFVAGDATTAISRMATQSRERELLNAALELVCAQRLVRKLCAHCKKPVDPPDEVLKRLGVKVPANPAFYKAAGCEQCNRIGYRGRIAVAEVIVPDDRLRRAISAGATADELRSQALERKVLTPLLNDAVLKAAQGITSLEEAAALV